jgi:hypothetical protein
LPLPQIVRAGFVHLRSGREARIDCFGFAQFRFACFILMGRETSRGVAFGAAASHEILVRLPSLLAIRASGKPVKSGFFDKSAYQQGTTPMERI